MIDPKGPGVVTRAVLNLMPIPAARWTALASFERVDDAALTVSEIIAGIARALEIATRGLWRSQAHLPSGYPTNNEAMLIVELDGEPDDVVRETLRSKRSCGVGIPRCALQ
jgi:glycolate oxidase